MRIDNVQDLIDSLKKHKILIYGAGYIAKRFYKAVCRIGAKDNVICFVTSNDQGIRDDEIPIIPLSQIEYDQDMLICIAVHEAILTEIIKNIQTKGNVSYIWVFPYLYELLLGAPEKRNVKVPLSIIWNSMRNNYVMAFRYLALDQYYGVCDDGYDMYVQGMSMFSSKDTAEKRLQQFIDLIKNWDEKGYDEKHASLLLADYTPIDGTHRIAIASYKKQAYVVCDIFPDSQFASDVHNDRAMLTKSHAKQLGLDERIIDRLEKMNQRIDKQYL